MTRYSASKRINAIVHRMLKAGWSALGRKSHPRIKSPDGKLTLTIPSSPSDWRSELNWISQARNSGVARELLA